MQYESERRNEKKFNGRDVVGLVLIVCLTIAAVVLASLYASSKAGAEEANERYQTTMENTYRKSYYGLVYNMDGLETAASKLSVARTKAMKQEYLSDISAYSTAAGEDMTNLVEEGADRSKLLKFINQTGDFAKYLDGKLAKGGEVSQRDEKTIGEILAVVRSIKTSLSEISGEVEKDGFSFLRVVRETEGGFPSMVRSFENEEIDYPSMIYDGPFSDSMTERTAKALPRENTEEERARERLTTLITNAKITDISVQEGSKNIFETYAYELQTTRGKSYVTLAKRGAIPVSVSFEIEQANELLLTAKQAEQAAEEYARSIGFGNMKAVWASKYNNVYYVNLACTQGDVILYPDLVKIKVSGETGEILGMDGINYIFNHTERPHFSAEISPSEAVLSISEGIDIKNVRLALVPTKGDGEALSYEIYGTKGSEKYFIYVSATTGEELKIMRVVDGERGLLLQ